MLALTGRPAAHCDTEGPVHSGPEGSIIRIELARMRGILRLDMWGDRYTHGLNRRAMLQAAADGA